MIKKLFKKVTGIEKIEKENARVLAEAAEIKKQAEEDALKAMQEAEEAKEKAEQAAHEEKLSKMTPKQRATELGEPYIEVSKVHLDPNKMNGGYLEFDWNELFITSLRVNGYGANGDPEEEIVDRWYRDICYNVAAEMNIDTEERMYGYINVKPLDDNKSEVS